MIFSNKTMIQIAVGLDRQKNIQWNGGCFDISEGGLELNTECALRKGEVVKLFIPVSKVDTPLPVFAEVMWTHPSEDRFKAGLRFL